MGSFQSVASILKDEGKTLAKVEHGGYLRERVECHFKVLRTVPEEFTTDEFTTDESSDEDDEDLTPEQKTARKDLAILARLEHVFFTAKNYIAYRPIPPGLSPEAVRMFKHREFIRWLNLNYHHKSFLSFAVEPSSEELLRVFMKLARDMANNGNWIENARQSVKSGTDSIYTISMSDLQSMEDRKGDEASSQDMKDCRSQLIRETVNSAMKRICTPKIRWKHEREQACKDMSEMVELVSAIYSSRLTENPDKWLEDCQRSFTSSNAN